MRFAKYTFLIAGIYGLLALLPMYFIETRYGVDDPPSITHPEFYYGFIGVAAAFQHLFQRAVTTEPIGGDLEGVLLALGSRD